MSTQGDDDTCERQLAMQTSDEDFLTVTARFRALRRASLKHIKWFFRLPIGRIETVRAPLQNFTIAMPTAFSCNNCFPQKQSALQQSRRSPGITLSTPNTSLIDPKWEKFSFVVIAELNAFTVRILQWLTGSFITSKLLQTDPAKTHPEQQSVAHPQHENH